MSTTQKTFDATVKGSGVRLTLEWLAKHPDLVTHKPLRGYLAGSVKAVRVWREPGSDSYGFALLVADEMTEMMLAQYAPKLREVIRTDYAREMGANFTQFAIETIR